MILFCEVNLEVCFHCRSFPIRMVISPFGSMESFIKSISISDGYLYVMGKPGFVSRSDFNCSIGDESFADAHE